MPRAISPNTGAPERVIAEDQLEYLPIPIAIYHDSEAGSPVLLTRWTFTDAERLAIAEGEDLYLGVMTFGHRLQPLLVSVGPAGYIVKEEG